MKKAILITIISLYAGISFSQADVVKSNKAKSKHTTVLEEVANKYGKSSTITEFLVAKISAYEKNNNVKVLSKEEFLEHIFLLKTLRKELAQEKDFKKKDLLQIKIDYTEQHRVEYSSMEVELLK